MKLILILFLLTVTVFFGYSQTDTIPIKIKLNLEKEYTKSFSKKDYWVKRQIEQQNLTVKSDSVFEHYYDITIEIENVGERDIYIWMMNCSWYDNFEINNNYIYFYHPGCDRNFPELEKIGAKSKITINGTVRRNIKFDYPNENSVYGKQVQLTKLGLIIIDDIYKPKLGMFDYILFMEDKSKHKLIWSNGINLLDKQPEQKSIQLK